MKYGLKDLQAPFIQFEGTLGQCYREAKGMGLCGLYRLESCGWVSVAKRYWSTFTHQKNIITVDRTI